MDGPFNAATFEEWKAEVGGLRIDPLSVEKIELPCLLDLAG